MSVAPAVIDTPSATSVWAPEVLPGVTGHNEHSHRLHRPGPPRSSEASLAGTVREVLDE